MGRLEQRDAAPGERRGGAVHRVQFEAERDAERDPLGRDADRARGMRALPEAEVQHAGELHLGVARRVLHLDGEPENVAVEAHRSVEVLHDLRDACEVTDHGELLRDRA